MENLYLIGNGFDKHHDIPSGYWDFHDWLKTKDEDLVEQIDELYDYNGDLWGNFEVELGNLNIEEKAIEIYREHPADEMSDHYERSFHEGAIVAGDTIGEIYNKILEQFPVWVKQLPKANPMKRVKVQDDSYYVTFNYTDTLIDLYDIPIDKILFIHGRVKTNRFLVLGHGKSEQQVMQESEKNFNEESHAAYIQTVQAIENQVNKMRKKTEKIIESNKAIFDSFKDVKHIYAYGLSMSEVDKPYFEEIINRIDVGNVTWHIDAHGKNCVSIARKGVAKRKFLASMGIPKSNVKVCTLEKMRVYKDNQLF